MYSVISEKSGYIFLTLNTIPVSPECFTHTDSNFRILRKRDNEDKIHKRAKSTAGWIEDHSHISVNFNLLVGSMELTGHSASGC